MDAQEGLKEDLMGCLLLGPVLDRAGKDLGGSSSGSEYKSDIWLCKSCPPEKALRHYSVISCSS